MARRNKGLNMEKVMDIRNEVEEVMEVTPVIVQDMAQHIGASLEDVDALREMIVEEQMKEINKFENIEKVNFDNLDVIKNSIGYLTCTLIDSLETSTHTIFLGKIINGDILNNNKNPMTYAYYHKVKKGLSPKNAPTYIEPKNETGYKCSICGYLYVGDITKENDDFICPICKQNKNVFIKV